MQVNPKGKKEGAFRGFRGGGCGSTRLTRSGSRYRGPPISEKSYLGFRVALSPVVRKKSFWNFVKDL